MKPVIFVGPTLSVKEAQQVLDAIYLPPVGQSDLLSAIYRYNPSVIGIIDGVFHQSLSVWHKEILFALSRGIQVFGASSMGALRAAETRRYGMVGVGEVYRCYVDGELEDDDEVAISHTSAEFGFRALSEAMVNLRVSFEAAAADGVVSSEVCNHLINIAKSLYFPDRTLPNIFRTAESEGIGRVSLDSLRAFLVTGYVDIKKQDALRLLETIRLLPESAPRLPNFDFARSMFFEIQHEVDRRVYTEDLGIELGSIVSHASIHSPEYVDAAFHARNRRLAVLLAELMGIQPTRDDILDAGSRFRAKLGLQDDVAFEAWRVENDLSPEGFDDLMMSLACCRVLHRVSKSLFPQCNVRDYLDELRLQGRYLEAKNRAAIAQHLAVRAHPSYETTFIDGPSMAQLVHDQRQTEGWFPEIEISDWAEEAGFKTSDDLYLALLRGHLARLGIRDLAMEVADGMLSNPTTDARSDTSTNV